MKTVITVGTDLHIGSCAHAEMDDYTELIRLDKSTRHVYLTGDIVDMTNCKKSMVDFYLQVIKRLKDHFRFRYVMGNHEARDIGGGFIIIDVEGFKVLLLHGIGIRLNGVYHPIYYSEKDTIKWENKEWGRGRFSAWRYKMWRRWSKHKGGYKKPDEEIIKRLVDITKLLGCKTVIWGHTHKNYDAVHDGIRLVNLEKGIHKVELEE